MKNVMLSALVLTALTFGAAQAQDKMQKKAEVAAAKGQVAADKADMKMMHDKKNVDKVAGDQNAVSQDNKDLINAKAKLTKDQVKKDAKQVKAKF